MTLAQHAGNSLDALTQSRRQAWLAAVAPDEPQKLARRLAWDGLDIGCTDPHRKAGGQFRWT
jgi:hypothetical protein